MVRANNSDSNPGPADIRQSSSSPSASSRPVEIPANISVRQLADLLHTSEIDIIKQLMRSGVMANINQVVDYELAAAIATGLGYQPSPQTRATRKPGGTVSGSKKEQDLLGKELKSLKLRPPVVTIMGHVNHGKTRLLDAIRQTNVMEAEAGGITQHIGAYQVEVNGQKVTFLDTPGHEAFTAMRARGAQVTDIVILVVAADDGVMPQTLEAIAHARAAGVPIVVAINKVDKPGVNVEVTKQQLADAGLVAEGWGGDTICIPISAKEKTGIHELLENLLLIAEMEELKADPAQPALGVVIEAKMDKAKGPLATVLINEGTLRLGETIVVGTTWGRVKAMFNDMGKRLRKAEPATPVEILGLGSVPQVGDNLKAVSNESQAQKLIEKRLAEKRQEPKAVNLSNLYDQISTGRVKELNIIIKVDVQGSIEPIKGSLEELGTEQVKVRVIHSGTGNVTETDVMLATASKGIIIGFGVSTGSRARHLAEIEGISIRSYDVIYDLISDVSSALKGMLEPSYVEVIEGRAEVRNIFTAGKKEKVAGAYVTEGKVSRGASVRLRRGEQMVCESTVSSLRRFKDDVKEVAAGYECGLGIKDFNSFQVGDVLEFFKTETRR
ncbi:MAG: translation initiation factor IF-2 [Dehalococcoidales bacterium]|nr:translation initiation factor IF-2 [Dehalococcoidales bacterium]